MTSYKSVDRTSRLRLAAAMLGVTFTLGGCMHTGSTPDGDITASVPEDYRLRHPIAIQETPRTLQVFVGTARGGLSASQRADVVALGQTWLREGTGSVIMDVPADTPNARAAADSAREIRSLLSATGVPPRGITMRNYKPTDPSLLATIRLNYPKISAVAGPCGTWPEDLGPSVKNQSYLDNKPFFNLGCSSQRNLAAMVDNPSDLVQPRPEAPAYTGRRAVALDKYRKGESSATAYVDQDKSKISSVGQ